ncbi:hypothetical protein EC968_006390 [Mortierella alpina]|nr:hypothetical protein EC968_006390 [Mortierella alpina]
MVAPEEGRASFAQIYIYDPAEQVRRRLAVFMRPGPVNGQQANNQQQQNQHLLHEEVAPVEDDMDPYDPIAGDGLDPDIPVQEQDVIGDDVAEPGQDLGVEGREAMDVLDAVEGLEAMEGLAAVEGMAAVEGLDPVTLLELQTMITQKIDSLAHTKTSASARLLREETLTSTKS